MIHSRAERPGAENKVPSGYAWGWAVNNEAPRRMPAQIFEANQSASFPAQLSYATQLKAVMQDHDSLWKKAIDAFMFECIAFCWPTALALVDCSVTPIFLEQELAPASGVRRRRVDKLAQLAAKSGDKLILHIEVQHRYDSNFERRMFSYLSRLQEKYTCPVHSLAILADNHRHWRPSSISLPILDGEILLRYPIFKLLDFDLQAEDLMGSENPFAVFAAIDLLDRHVRHDISARLALKCRAMQALFQHAEWTNRTTWLLLSLLDQIIELPVELQSQFEDQMHSMDKRRCNMDIDMELMPRFAEKIRDKAREEGLSQGHQQGRAEGLLDGQRQTMERLLTIRFGNLPEEALKRIRGSSLDELERWTRNLCDAPTPADVFRA